MAKRKRNYKHEYRRRKARGKRLGLSRAAARGHARAGERTRPAGIATNPPRARKSGLKMMKHGSSLKGVQPFVRLCRIGGELLGMPCAKAINAPPFKNPVGCLCLRRG